MRRGETSRGCVGEPYQPMGEERREPPESGAIDYDILDQIAHRLAGSTRFSVVQSQPEYAPSSVVADYEMGYFPSGVERAYLRIRWFETNDFSVHYSEQYSDDTSWECRWDRHPNGHNTRGHFHPPPDAATPGEDAEFADDWRDILTSVLNDLDDRVKAFWD